MVEKSKEGGWLGELPWQKMPRAGTFKSGDTVLCMGSQETMDLQKCNESYYCAITNERWLDFFTCVYLLFGKHCQPLI
jgi:hypothetical protein